VGTDFFLEYVNGTMNVIAFEGLVKVCNLAGVACSSRPRNDERAQRRQFRAAAATAGDARSTSGFQQGHGSRSPGRRVRSGAAPWCLGRSESSRELSELVWVLG